MFFSEVSKGYRMFMRKWHGLTIFHTILPPAELDYEGQKGRTVKVVNKRVVGYLTVPCNPRKIQGSWVQLVGLFRSFQHTCWLNKESYTVGGIHWLRPAERVRKKERYGMRRGIWTESEWQLKKGEAGQRWVNVVRLTDGLEKVGYYATCVVVVVVVVGVGGGGARVTRGREREVWHAL